jgi:hypothetical protein
MKDGLNGISCCGYRKKQWTFQLQKLPVMIDPFFKLMGLLGLPSI